MKKIYLVLILFAALFASGVFVSLSNLKPSAPISEPKQYDPDNCIVPYNIATTIHTKYGNVFWYFKKEFTTSALNMRMTYTDSTFINTPVKTIDRDAIIYLTEGKAIINLLGKEQEIGSNTAVYVPAGADYSINRADTLPLRYLTIIN